MDNIIFVANTAVIHLSIFRKNNSSHNFWAEVAVSDWKHKYRI